VSRGAAAKKAGLIVSAHESGRIAAALTEEVLALAYLRIACIAVAVEQYAIDHEQRLPRTLTDLARLYLAIIPSDPSDGASITFTPTGKAYTLVAKKPSVPESRDSPGAGLGREVVFKVARLQR
jgi:hypothetical protein